MQAASLGEEPDTDELEEAGIASNDIGQAIKLSGNVKIVGDVTAVGSIEKDASVEIIRGVDKQFQDPAEIPEIDFAKYDPLGDPADPSDDRPTLVERTESVVLDAVNNPLYGFQRFSGNTTFPDGLKLDGSAIFVDGDLILDGPLVGSGLVVATGDVTLRGGANMKADVLAAVLAKGDLTIGGTQDPLTGETKSSTFQGLMYAEGDLTLTKTRTVGTAISAGSATGGPGKLTVEDSTVISTPDTSDFRLVVKTFATDPGPQGMAGISVAKSGKGWELLEPNPADFLTEDVEGNPVFLWDDSYLKIRVQPDPPSGPWVIINEPGEAEAAGLVGSELETLRAAYGFLDKTWREERVTKLNREYKKELVEIIEFDLNEFLNVSSRLQAKRVFYAD